MASQDRQWQAAATGEGHSVSLHSTFPASHSYHLTCTSSGTFLGISVMDMCSKIKILRFFPQYPETPRNNTKKLMPVPRGATDLPPSADWDAVVTAHLTMLRTSFNTKNNPKATSPQNGTECLRICSRFASDIVGKPECRKERTKKQTTNIFKLYHRLHLSLLLQNTTMQDSTAMATRILWLAYSRNPNDYGFMRSAEILSEGNKPPSSTAQEQNFTTPALHMTMESGPYSALSQYPQVSFSFESLVNVVSSSQCPRWATGSSRVTPAALHHDSSCRTTSTQLCRHHLICILGWSYQAPIKIWPYPQQTKNYIR